MSYMHSQEDSLYSERGRGGLGHYDYYDGSQAQPTAEQQQQHNVQQLLNDHFNRAGDVQLTEVTGSHHAG